MKTTEEEDKSLKKADLRDISRLPKADKTQLIKSYICSQRTYRTTHVADGKAVQASWNQLNDPHNELEKPIADDSRPVFDTPILKPRVPLPPSEGIFSESDSTSDVISTKKQAKHKDNPKKLKNQDVRQRKRLVPERLHVETTAPNKSNRNTLDCYIVKAANSNPAKSDKKRARSSDSEREVLLAERRERRRAKKAIVAPKKTADDNSDDESRLKARAKASKGASQHKGKASKGSNLAAGLSIMHGFNATNVGCSRITFKPTFGVFTKGKASTKADVKGINQSKKPGVWCESQFLNETPRRPPEDASSSDASNDSDGAKGDQKHGTENNRNPKQLKVERKKRAVEASSVTSHSTLEKAQSLSEQARSIIWDIELGNYNSQDDEKASAVRSDIPNSTLVVDTRRFDWHAPSTKSSLLPNQCPATLAGADTLLSEVCLMSCNTPPSQSLPFNAQAACNPLSQVSVCPSAAASQAGDSNGQFSPIQCSKYFSTKKKPTESEERSNKPHGVSAERVLLPPPLAAGFSRTGFESSADMHGTSQPLEKTSDYLCVDQNEKVESALEISHNSEILDDLEPLVIHCDLTQLPHLDIGVQEDIKSSSDYLDYWNWPATVAHATSEDFENLSQPQAAENLSHIEQLNDTSPELNHPDHLLLDQYAPYYDDLQSSADEPNENLDPGCTVVPDCSMVYMDEWQGNAPLMSIVTGDITSDFGELAGSCSYGRTQTTSPSLSACDQQETFMPEAPNFSQGRALLLGMSESCNTGHRAAGGVFFPTISKVEETVAKGLKGHWLPQKL